jgi:hypothetical protein
MKFEEDINSLLLINYLILTENVQFLIVRQLEKLISEVKKSDFRYSMLTPIVLLLAISGQNT